MGKEDNVAKLPLPHVSPAVQARAPDAVSRRTWYVSLLVALLLGLALGYGGSRRALDADQRQYDALKRQFEVTTAQHLHDLNAALMRADAFQGQLAVEESTRKSLEAALLTTQQDLGRVRDQLAFFNQLLPSGPKGSISIRALDIERHGSILNYKALLMRNAPGDTTFNGLMEFVANGTQNGKAVKMILQPAEASGISASADVPAAASATAAAPPDAPAGGKAEAPKLDISFDQFQRSEGLLSIPAGFVPQTVTLNILEGKTLRVSRSVTLSPVP